MLLAVRRVLRLAARRTRNDRRRRSGQHFVGGARLLHVYPLLGERGPVDLIVGHVLVRRRIQWPLDRTAVRAAAAAARQRGAQHGLRRAIDEERGRRRSILTGSVRVH